MSTPQTSQYSSFDQSRWLREERKNPARTEFERDRGRVLHSSALRRLGTKTQVLGFEFNDFIRTRLTHSLEVGQVGRSLAKNLGADPDLVETACLCHDLGHPPFGHNGEDALADVARDFGGFEGNAQTLRILTRLEPKRFFDDGTSAGLNLTRATLDATIKYPWARGKGPRNSDGEPTKKFGVYSDDLDAFTFAHETHGFTRPLEADIMDSSDDIAYSIHDFEDGIVRGAIPMDKLTDAGEQRAIVDTILSWYRPQLGVAAIESALERLITMPGWLKAYNGTFPHMAQLKDLTSALIGRCVGSITRATQERYGTEPLSRYQAQLCVPAETAAEILVLKGLGAHYVMAPRATEPNYLEQRAIIYDLFDAIVESPETTLDEGFYQLWLAADFGDRMRIVVDQIASLTDTSARQLHARTCGMLRN